MKKFYTSLLSLSVVAFCSINTFAQQIAKGQNNGLFPKKTAAEKTKSHGFDRCSAVEYEVGLKKKYPTRMSDQEFEAWLAPLVEKAKQERIAGKSQNGGIITIPVVVHVIHSGEPYGTAPNITDEQVQSQITVMNQDFRRMSGTPGFNSNPVGADTMIQFALAKVDLNGNPTNGINRVNLCAPSWDMDDIDDIVKPATIWDATQYMNMWSINFSDSSLLGYAQFPSNSGLQGLNANGGLAITDGVVANWSTFGSTDFGTFPMNAPYDKGRTMTHEVGHFLGLRHIWGDSTCGNDFCADTPTAHTANYTCNPNIASCTDPNIKEMVQNYMDYTNDQCMNIFTINQKDRITAVMNNSPRRSTLKTSVKDIAIPLFANDAEVKLENSCGATATCTVAAPVLISLYNRGTSTLTSATINYTINGAPYSFSWSGSLAQNKYAIVALPGVSTSATVPLSVSVATVNGVADQRATNNTATGTYNSPAVPNTLSTTVQFNLQLDYWGSETKWTLKNGAGATLYSGGPYTDVPNPTTSTPLPALITQNWTLSADDCYTFTITDTYGDGMYNYGGYYNIKETTGALITEGAAFAATQSRPFRKGALSVDEVSVPKVGIYPNPATDILNVTNVSDKANFKIYASTGQLVKTGKVEKKMIDISSLETGVYIISVIDNDKEVINTKFIKK